MEIHECDYANGAVPGDQEGIGQQLARLRAKLERLEALQRARQERNFDFVDEAEEKQTQPLPIGDLPEPTTPRRRPARLILATILAVWLCVGAFKCWRYIQSYESTDDAQVDGYLDPISSRINGTVTAVYVNNNQSVKQGQLLAQLDPRDYRLAVEQAEAELAQTVADLKSARQQYVSAVASIRQGQAQNYLAQRNRERYAKLMELRVVAQSEFDQYDATARADAATVQVDEAVAASAQRTIASREARVQQAQAALAQAELNLSYTRITAPADGIIGNRSAQLGQRVQPGQTLMALTQMNHAGDLWVTANFKETQLVRVRPGQPATMYVDAFRRNFTGHVLSIAGATGSLYDLLPPENATGNYVKIVQRLPVRLTFDPGQDLGQLRPGMSVVPTVWLQKATSLS